MKKFILAPALAALAMFFLGFLYWGLPASPAYKAFGQLADDDAAAQALGKIFPGTGTYIVPGIYLDQTKLTELNRRGPSAQVVFIKEGHNPTDPAMFIKGYLHYFVVALLLMFMLEAAKPSFKAFSCRVKFSAAIGLIGGVLWHFSDPIWGHHPLPYHLVGLIYMVLEFMLAGLVLAKFTLTPAVPAPADTPAEREAKT
jgi:hypothetical protein